MQVYPTITNGLVNIQLPGAMQNSMVRILNSAGKQVAINLDKTSSRSVNLSRLPAGAYMVHIVDQGKVVTTSKVVLQK